MCVHIFNSGTASVFTPASIAGCSDQLCESTLGVAQTSAHLECVKLQQQIVEEKRARVQAVMAAQRNKKQKDRESIGPLWGEL